MPPKIFLSLVYKLERPSNVRVALELTTRDAGSCHVGGLSAWSGEGGVAAASSQASPLLRTPRGESGVFGELVLAVSGSPAPVFDGATVGQLWAGRLTSQSKLLARSPLREQASCWPWHGEGGHPGVRARPGH